MMSVRLYEKPESNDIRNAHQRKMKLASSKDLLSLRLRTGTAPFRCTRCTTKRRSVPSDLHLISSSWMPSADMDRTIPRRRTVHCHKRRPPQRARSQASWAMFPTLHPPPKTMTKQTRFPVVLLPRKRNCRQTSPRRHRNPRKRRLLPLPTNFRFHRY